MSFTSSERGLTPNFFPLPYSIAHQTCHGHMVLSVKNWQHPAASLTRAVASDEAMLLAAYAGETTRIFEFAWVRFSNNSLQ